MSNPNSEHQDLPELTQYQEAKIDLQIGALEHGLTDDQELQMRVAEIGGVVVSPHKDVEPTKTSKLLRKILGIEND